jgi:hypothetical protein
VTRRHDMTGTLAWLIAEPPVRFASLRWTWPLASSIEQVEACEVLGHPAMRCGEVTEMLRRGVGELQVAGLVVSALALMIAPLLMPASYSWIAHTTSESAAQGVPGAWLARAGFLVFGSSVLWIAWEARGSWNRCAIGLHATFGMLMVAAGTFSARPWDAQLPFSSLEDLLHSVAATAMGFAFAVGVTVVAVQRWRVGGGWRAPDLVAVTASIVLPLAMASGTGLTGVLQRTMFLIAYLWYAGEALRPQRPAAPDSARSGRQHPTPAS